MEKIQVEVTMKNIYKYEAPAFGYGYEERYIYVMEDQLENQYVWKTTVHMGYEVADPNGWITYDQKNKKGTFRFDEINRNDVVIIKAFIKGENEYNGQVQTELTRVKVIDRTFKAETWEEKQAKRKKEQVNSIVDGDYVWEMPYRQYKEHYNDCETIIDSYNRTKGTIAVIIREGRLKASGVRGEHFKGYGFHFIDDEKTCSVYYRAVKEENALKRLMKDYPNAKNVQLDNIYI